MPEISITKAIKVVKIRIFLFGIKLFDSASNKPPVQLEIGVFL